MTPLPKNDAPALSRARLGVGTAALTGYARQHDLILACLHGPGCAACARIAAELHARLEELEAWGAAVLAAAADGSFELPLRQAADPDGRLRRELGGNEADAVIAVFERRGVLMEGWALRHPEAVDWREVAETARWVALREPECGTCEVLPGYE
jgi:hypothetical protein